MIFPTTVSAIVPARNEEETIASAVESLATQPEIGEIIVINDQSTDRTARILAELATRIPQLRCLETHGLPSGWTGKNYALALGAAAAEGQWLLFTDADATHLSASTARALAAAAETDAALISYSPEQELRTWWERALIPFIFCRLAQKFSFTEVSTADSAAAAANGQYLLVRKDAYEAVGGHQGVAGEVLEDVAMARLIKSAGYKLYFGSGHGIVRVRMYRTFSGMWQGWTKNLYPLMTSPGKRLWRELISVFPWFSILLLGLALLPIPVRGSIRPFLAILGLLFLAGRHAVYAGLLLRNRFPVSCILYYCPGVAIYAVTLMASARRYARGTVVWKGREYPVVTPGN